MTAYAARTDVEAIFGQVNIYKWADADQDQNDGKVAARIDWALTAASAAFDNRLRLGTYAVPVEEPDAEFVSMVARAAGVMLYDNRGHADANADGDPINRMLGHRRLVDKFLDDIRRGRVRLPQARTLSQSPSVVPVCPTTHEPRAWPQGL